MSFKIGIVAPSSCLPPAELELGISKIKNSKWGELFEPVIHPQCRLQHRYFAGTHEQRAKAFLEFAFRKDMPVIWTARGGSGALQLLPLLEKAIKKGKKPPKKTLVGYSDSTLLHEFVRKNWGWKTLHAPMPGLKEFIDFPEGESWDYIFEYLWAQCTDHTAQAKGVVKQLLNKTPWNDQPLRSIGKKSKFKIEAPVIGGNLAVWTSMMGTSIEPKSKGKILFFEEVSEPLYKIDRLVAQIEASGGFRGVKAIVLGDFSKITDPVPQVIVSQNVPALGSLDQAKAWVKSLKQGDLGPLRESIEPSTGVLQIFRELSLRLGIPVVFGIGVGHNPDRKNPLPLGDVFELTQNSFKLIKIVK